MRLFDHRKISGSGRALPVEQFEGHSAAVLCVQVRLKRFLEFHNQLLVQMTPRPFLCHKCCSN